MRDHIIRRLTQQLCNHTELIDMILSGEKRSTQEHLGEDTSRTPDIDFFIVPAPSEHDLGGAVIPGRNVTGHFVLLDTGQTEVADFQIAVFVDEDVAWFEIAVDDPGRVDVFETALGGGHVSIWDWIVEWIDGLP